MKIQNQYHQDMMKLIHRIDELYSSNATCNFNELPQEYRSSLHSKYILFSESFGLQYSEPYAVL